MPNQLRVWALVLAIGGTALVLAAVGLAPIPALDPDRRLPWWLMAAGFWAAEAWVIHFHFRRGAHTFSLNEMPLVVGFFLAAPLELVVAQAIGSAAALAIHRRQPPVKLVFNIAAFAVSSGVGLLVFQLPVGILADRWGRRRTILLSEAFRSAGILGWAGTNRADQRRRSTPDSS